MTQSLVSFFFVFYLHAANLNLDFNITMFRNEKDKYNKYHQKDSTKTIKHVCRSYFNILEMYNNTSNKY